MPADVPPPHPEPTLRFDVASDRIDTRNRVSGLCLQVFDLSAKVAVLPYHRGRQDRRWREVEGDCVRILNAARELTGATSELGRLVDACLSFAEVARTAELESTAGQFLEAARRLDWSACAPLLTEARAAERDGDDPRAERLYREAIDRTSRSAAWSVHSRAWLGLGNVHRRRGEYPAATEAYLSALRAARTHSIRTTEAEALHNLAIMALIARDAEAGLAYARKALDAYGRRVDMIRILANDLAWYWMDSEAAYAASLQVFEFLLPRVTRPVERLLTTANLVRAAAGAGDLPRYDAALAQLTALVDADPTRGQRVADALLEAAKGALKANRAGEATGLANRALQIARGRGEAEAEATAVDLLARAERAADASPPASPHEPRSTTQYQLSQLASHLVLMLGRHLQAGKPQGGAGPAPA
jgi:tetratricopeptide (TPR) repeat protein